MNVKQMAVILISVVIAIAEFTLIGGMSGYYLIAS